MKFQVILIILISSIGQQSKACQLETLIKEHVDLINKNPKKFNSLFDEFNQLLYNYDITDENCVHSTAMYAYYYLRNNKYSNRILVACIEWDKKFQIDNDSLTSRKYFLLGVNLKMLHDYQSAITKLDTALNLARYWYHKDHIAIQKIYQNLAECYYISEKPYRSFQHLDSAYAKLTLETFHNRKYRIFKYYAKNYAKLGDAYLYDMYTKAYETYLKVYHPSKLSQFYMDLLYGYESLQENKKCIDLCERVERDDLIDFDNKKKFNLYYHTIGKCYYNLSNPELAKYYWKKIDYKNSAQPSYETVLTQIIIESMLAKFSKKYLLYEEKTDELVRLAKANKNIKYIRVGLHNSIATKFLNGKYYEAYELQKELSDLIFFDKKTNFPSFDTELDFYLNSFKVLSALYSNSQQVLFLEKAYEWVLKMDKSISKKLEAYVSDNSTKIKLAPKKELYIQAMQICFDLSKITNEDKYALTAMHLSEQNKAIVLLNNASKKLNNISLINLSRTNELKGSLDSLKLICSQAKTHKNQKDKKTKHILATSTKQSLLAANAIHDNIQKLVKLKEASKVNSKKLIVDIEEVNNLSNVISYTYADTFLFRIYNYESNIQFDKIEINNAIKEDLIKLKICTIDPKCSISDNTIQHLSNVLLPEKLSLEEPIKFIPDDILNFIPFEFLQYMDQSLLAQVATSYAFSRRHLLAMQNNEVDVSKKKIICFSPEYNEQELIGNNNLVLAKLDHNGKEIENIKDHFPNATSFSGDFASLNNFNKVATQAKILHIAAHAKSDTSEASCHIYFTPTKENYTLSLSDIYKMNMPAELVTLSACETGTGEHLIGEGVLSLGRGFAYAGAKAVVSSLWSANDHSTSMIMSSFYKFLKEGQRKDEALRNAKLEYLSNTDSEYHHPYYWAAFIPMGDMRPLSEDKKLPQWYGALALALALGAGGVGFRNSLKKT